MREYRTCLGCDDRFMHTATPHDLVQYIIAEKVVWVACTWVAAIDADECQEASALCEIISYYRSFCAKKNASACTRALAMVYCARGITLNVALYAPSKRRFLPSFLYPAILT